MQKIKNETKLVKWIVLLPIIAVLTTSLTLTYFFIKSKYESYEKEINVLEKSYTDNVKLKIKKRIDNILNLIKNNYKYQNLETKKNIKNLLYLGYSILETIYEENKDKSKDEIYKEIFKRMNDIRFFENKSGYFFIYNLKDDTIINLPFNPKYEGKKVFEILSPLGYEIYKKNKALLENKDETYSTWFWNKPEEVKKSKKIGFIKKFKPLNLMIGTAVYEEDIKQLLTKSTLEIIKNLRYPDESYIFVLNKKGVTLHHKNKDIIGVPLNDLAPKILENVNKILSALQDKDSAFIEYIQDKMYLNNFQQSHKISYVSYNSEFEWILGTGLYIDKLNKRILETKKNLEDKLYEDISLIVGISFLISFIIILLLIIVSNKIKKLILFYSETLKKKNKELKELNLNLESKVKQQVDSLREKDFMLHQQSKLAAMGEMIGNIAHQWRQPLSAICSLASGAKLKKELGVLNYDQLDEDLQNIVDSTNILSSTIDDFRDFYSNKKEKTYFEVNTVIDQISNLVNANLKSKHILIKKDIDNIKINSYKNELLQVLLNLINNSKDALVELEEKEVKLIFIKIKKENKTLKIEVLDNAKGIKEELLTRIFEPYFTTKFKSRGTGIGLYMSKNIVDNSLNGEISVENETYEYENKKYKGAKFTIKIPI